VIAGSLERGPDATAANGAPRTTIAEARRAAPYPVLLLGAADASEEGGVTDVFVSRTEPISDGYYVYYKSGLEISITPSKFPLMVDEELTDTYPMDTPEGTAERTRFVETTVRGNRAISGDAFTQTLGPRPGEQGPRCVELEREDP
jgi:hypothetical protein